MFATSGDRAPDQATHREPGGPSPTSNGGMSHLRSVTPRRAVLVWALLATSIAVVVLGAAPAGACSCAAVTDREALEEADVLFTGTLVSTASSSGNFVGSGDPERFVFEVDEVFKGEVSSRQTIVTARSGSSCGLEISGRGPFVVFAYTDSSLVTGAEAGELYSYLCSGTRPLTDRALPAAFSPVPRPWLRSAGAGAVSVAAVASETTAGVQGS